MGMKKYASLIICLILLCAGYLYGNTLEYNKADPTEVITKGIVLKTEEIVLTEEEQEMFPSQNMPHDEQWFVQVKITKGPYKGQEYETVHYYGNNPAYDFMVYPGDEVVLSLDINETGNLQNVFISDIARDKSVSYLFLLFMVCIMLVGGWQGLKTILSLVLTGWAVWEILLPAILGGKDPILITVILCAGISVITLLLITGYTRKTFSAICGTVLGVVLGGVLAKYIIAVTRITGLGSEESRMFYFSFAEGKIDITGILFAGIVIGSLGAVMDVAMSIASSVSEIHQINSELGFTQLIKSGLNIGRDIIGTMANTLILAYTGSALPLMLLLKANNIPYLKFISFDLIVTEIIRALCGSIGLFLAVPFTALIAAFICKRQDNKAKSVNA